MKRWLSPESRPGGQRWEEIISGRGSSTGEGAGGTEPQRARWGKASGAIG